MQKSLVLGIETSGTATGVALASGGKVLAELTEGSGCGHNEVLLPLLDRLFKSTATDVRELSGVGVDTGPGMFTSLRVGTSTAKGLAVALRVPTAGVSSLWALARTARPGSEEVLSLIDARKHQFYAALYLRGQPAIPPSLRSAEQLVAELSSKRTGDSDLVVAGNGAGICAELLEAGGVHVRLAGIEYPSPGVIALEAGERIRKGLADDATAIEPVYLRRTDAELIREKKLSPGR